MAMTLLDVGLLAFVVLWFAGLTLGFIDLSRRYREPRNRRHIFAKQVMLLPLILFFAGAVFGSSIVFYGGLALGVAFIIGWLIVRIHFGAPKKGVAAVDRPGA